MSITQTTQLLSDPNMLCIECGKLTIAQRRSVRILDGRGCRNGLYLRTAAMHFMAARNFDEARPHSLANSRQWPVRE